MSDDVRAAALEAALRDEIRARIEAQARAERMAAIESECERHREASELMAARVLLMWWAVGGIGKRLPNVLALGSDHLLDLAEKRMMAHRSVPRPFSDLDEDRSLREVRSAINELRPR